ncbi:putative mitochondrial F1F0-ATP synthase g subunit [Lentithecium fluviatile CBS 122367]|uniref:Putative mitochondrial F1F0-ATP synthase g subunit n=1 Tax=Lentithecium fluviatile CBS 122367 TaxID=1168545 RepID=A0A6G1IIF9_9PLEO|nr:putative mitochondrial F1F0-ATP synthase g subunit [Lentithecium fluviatile CBS 122367]
MSAAASRAVLRQSRFAVRRAGVRNASSTTEAAKEKASEASSKASEGLSRVTSSAGAAASKVGSAVTETASKVGGRTGRLIGGVQALIPRVTYYSRVGLELGKLIAHQRGMAPPNMATIQTYFQPVVNAVRNPASLFARTAQSSSAQPANILNQVRSMSSTQWLSAGVVAAEVVGFFTVGEMLGRLKIVGYRAKEEHH